MIENKLTNQKPIIMMNKNYQMKRLKLNFYFFLVLNIGSFNLQVASYIFMITIVEG